MFARELQTRGGRIVRRHDDVLEKIPEARLDGAFISADDVEIIGNRSHLRDVAIRLGQHAPRAVTIFRARRLQLFEREQSRLDSSQLAFAGSQLGQARVAIAAGAGQLGLAGGFLETKPFHRLDRAAHGALRFVALCRRPLGFDVEIAAFDVEAANLLRHARSRSRGMFHRVTKRRGRVDGGEDLASRRLDVSLEPLDVPLQIRVGGLFRLKRLRGRVSFSDGARRRLVPRCELQPRRFTPGVERPHLGLDIRYRCRQRFDLLLVERDLLLQPTDFELAGMKIGALAGLVLSVPFILYQLWLFIAPGLYSNEKKMAVPFVIFCTIFFALGALFSHYVAFPWTWKFFLGWQTEYMEFRPSIGEAFGLYVKMLLGFGLIFQMPTIVFFLARFGLVSARFLLRNTKYAVLIIFIVAAVISPGTDVVSQCLMAGPMLALYGVSILVAWAFAKPRNFA